MSPELVGTRLEAINQGRGLVCQTAGLMAQVQHRDIKASAVAGTRKGMATGITFGLTYI